MLRRVALAALTVWIVSLIVFSALNILPADPATAALGHEATPDMRAAYRHLMNLDLPPATRYMRWASGMLHGDFGVSVVSRNPIAPELAQRFVFTAILGVASLVLSVLVALPLAVLSARRSHGIVDVGISTAAIA